MHIFENHLPATQKVLVVEKTMEFLDLRDVFSVHYVHLSLSSTQFRDHLT